MRCIKLLSGILLGLLCVGPVWAEGVLTPAANPSTPPLYNFHYEVHAQDDFMHGDIGTGSVGELGWSIGGGAVGSAVANVVNRPGIYRLDTSATINSVSRLNQFGAANFRSDQIAFDALFHIRLNQTDANTIARVGFANSWSSNPPSDGVYFERLGADTNWFCVNRASSSETRTDTGIAASTSFLEVRVKRASAASTWSVNGVPTCGTMTANLTSVFGGIGMHISTSAAAAKTMDIDYIEYHLTGISR